MKYRVSTCNSLVQAAIRTAKQTSEWMRCGGVWATAGLIVLLFVAYSATSIPRVGAANNITTIDVTGAGSSALQGTFATATDASGDVTGIYLDSSFTAHGFIRASGGTITAFDAPGAGTTSSSSGVGKSGTFTGLYGTFPIAINSGTIAGFYLDGTGGYHGLVRLSGGTITEFDVSGAVGATFPVVINSSGVIAGTYHSSTGSSGGFVRAANGAITTFQVPAAGIDSYASAVPTGIDTAGDVIGTYFDGTSWHGFERFASGTITTFDAPNAGGVEQFGYYDPTNYEGTIPLAINDSGTIAGTYTDKTAVARHGFVMSATGTTTSFDIPGAGINAIGYRYHEGTGGFAIDPNGDVAGTYIDANSIFHGFLRSSSGIISIIDVPNAGTGTLQGTGALSINANGQIAGTYADSNFVLHGFLLNSASSLITPTVTVTPASTSVTTAQSLSVTVTVSGGSSNPTPTGSVILTAGNFSSAATTLSSGSATIIFPAGSLAVGANTLTATYTPDSNSASTYYGSTGTASVTVTQASVTSFDAPEAGASAFQGTLGLAIDSSGDVSGTYLDSSLVAHGYFRAANGTIATFSAPGAGTTSGIDQLSQFSVDVEGTIPLGVNSAATVTGTYIDSDLCYHGFVRTSSGTLTEFDAGTFPSGSCTSTSGLEPLKIGTRPIAINASGTTTGVFLDGNFIYHGFVRTAVGTITTFNVPGAETSEGGPGGGAGSIPLFIDTAGDVVGTYTDSNTNYHGFIRAASGAITTFDAPNAVGGVGGLSRYGGTIPLCANDSGTIAGTYTDANGARHGFIRSASGVITSFDIPGAGTGTGTDYLGLFEGTAAMSMDATGDVAGLYLDSNAAFHGFLRSASGTITTLNITGAGTGILQGTGAFSMNASGQVAGTYMDSSYVFHAFLLNSASLITPTVTVTPTSSSITTLQSDSVTVTVSGGSGNPTPTGSVVLTSGSYTSASTALSSGSATISVPAGSLAAGSNTLTATYTPDTNSSSTYNSATGTSSTVTVSKAAPMVTVTPSPASITTAQSTSVTVAVSAGSGAATATGSVTLTSGTYSSGAITLTGGSATITVPAGSLAVATDTLTATYAPDTAGSATYIGSTGSNTVTVTKATPTVTVTPNPSSITTVQSTQVTVTVSAGSGSPTATGSVMLTSGTYSSVATTLSGGSATITIPAGTLPSGTITVTATYTPDTSGSALYNGNTGSNTVTVGKIAPTVTVTPNPVSITTVQSTQVTVTVNGGSGNPTPTGSVVLTSGSYTSASTTLSSGSATISVPAGSLAAGSDTLTAAYTPDTNGSSTYLGATGTANVTVSVPVPTLTGISPGFVTAGSSAFTITASGSSFISTSTIYWGTTALTTTYSSSTSLSAPVSASLVANSGQYAVQVVSGSGSVTASSNTLQFEVDSGSSGSGPTFTTITATVTAGSSATYPVTLPSGATNVSVTCLNLPTGASCSYNASTGAVTITTSSSTPAGTYQITVVFSETLPGAAMIFLPFLLLPLAAYRRRLAKQRVAWLCVCVVLALGIAAGIAACGGGGGGGGGSTTPQTHTATNSGAVTLTVQ